MFKRFLNVFLVSVLLITSFPTYGLSLSSESADDNYWSDSGFAIGNIAELNMDMYVNFHITDDPQKYNDDYWEDETYWIYNEDDNDEIPNDSLQFVVTNYYYDTEREYLWFKVEAAPGYELPDKLKEKSYILHLTYPEEDPSLLIQTVGKNYVLDENGDFIENVTLPYFETVELTAESTLIGNVHYQWQIYAGGEWVDISGEDSNEIRLFLGMVKNVMINNTANIRCVASSGSKVVIGDSIEIIVQDYVYPEPEGTDELALFSMFDFNDSKEDSFDEQAAVDEELINENQEELKTMETVDQIEDSAIEDFDSSFTFEQNNEEFSADIEENEEFVDIDASEPENVEDSSIIDSQESALDDIVASLFGVLNVYAEENTDNPEDNTMVAANETYNIVVKYVFGDGSEAANPYVAQVQKGEFSDTVVFPPVPGYKPTYQGADADKLEIREDVNSDITYTVVYVPVLVDYSIEVYFQNVENDEYSFKDVYKLQGLTGETVPHMTLNFEGMYELLHATPEIAADGSTRLEVYFNRTYYLMQFDLDGGRGVYSMYSRYGAKFRDNIGTPINPGHSFVGWDDITDGPGDGIADEVPETIPNMNKKYKALWKENNTVLVRIALWGQNANDDLYSYISSKDIYVKPGTVLNMINGGYICGIEEHSHTADCAKCGKTVHVHDNSCYDCDASRHTVHSNYCYEGVGEQYSNNWGGNRPTNAPYNPSDGQVYVRNYQKYIYINGKWYNYSGDTSNGQIAPLSNSCPKKNHSHSDECLETVHGEHTHDASCYPNCLEHIHTDEDCKLNSGLESDLWTLVNSDTVTVEADGSTVINVYYDRTTFTLTFRVNRNTVAEIKDRKWGSSISGEFKKAPFSTTYDGRAWKCTDTNKYSAALQTLDIMPAFDATFDLYDKSSNTLKTIYYYVQKPGTTVNENEWPDNADNFVLFKEVNTYFNYATYDEEYHELVGYKRYLKAIAGFGTGNTDRKDFVNNKMNLYYLSEQYPVEFYSENEKVKTESVPYLSNLSDFADYKPDLPLIYDKGSYEFAGWYDNDVFQGNPLDLSKVIVEADTTILYAKWTPVKHDVEIYTKKNSDGTYEGPIFVNGSADDATAEKLDPVLHGQKVFETAFKIPDPQNTPYKFIGWFTTEPNGEERMWDFEHSVVTRDTIIYAKWSSEVLVPYTINYVLKDGTKIADSITSSALAGTTMTFQAKVEKQLYDGYQTGYFPHTSSHSITMDASKVDEGMEFDFVYVPKDKVKYTVNYVDTHGNPVAESNEYETTHAIVTEKFVFVADYTPDAFQKSLILSADKPDENVITFVYSKDSTQGVYQVTHYIQNLDGTGYLEHSSYGGLDTVGKILEITPLTIKGELNGFRFVSAKVNDADASLSSKNTIDAEVTNNGTSIELYYHRNKYSYKIQYLDKETLNVLKEADIVKDVYFGTNVACSTPPVIENYDFLSAGTCIIAVDDVNNPEKNIITVYYQEKTVQINYVVVGNLGGKVDPESTMIKVIAREGSGAVSTATADKNYRFVGWYSDEECKPEDLITENEMLVLKKNAGETWEEATYYAKFEPSTGDLTITKSGAASEEQVFIYEIVDKNDSSKKYYLTVTGNSSNTIHDLPFGEYQITQRNDWSWRYDANDEVKSSVIHQQSASGTQVVFSDTQSFSNWLNDNSELWVNERRNS